MKKPVMLAKPIKFASKEEREAHIEKLRKEIMVKFAKTLAYLAKH